MANSNFVVHNGLTVGPLTIDAATGTVTTTGPILSTGTTPTTFQANIVANSAVDSTSTTSGAIVVNGGVGVSGNIYVGGSIYANSIVTVSTTQLSVQSPLVYLTATPAYPYNYDIGMYSHFIGGPANVYAHTGMVRSEVNSWWGLFSNVRTEPSGTVNWSDAGLIWDTMKAGGLLLANTTASTSTTSGALQVAGGAGIAGNITVGGGAMFSNARAISKQVTTASGTAPSATVTKVGDEWYDSSTDTLYQYLNDGTTNGIWVDISSVPYNYQSNIALAGATLSITGNGSVGNLTVSGKLSATATSALYADLAELYMADTNYEAGTVVVFGGDAEITQSTTDHDSRVAGVISTDPAYLMNNGHPIGTYHPVALTGRVPCRVQGPVNKGQVLVTGTEPGTAQAIDAGKFQPGVVLGKSLANITDNSVQTIEVAVGRF
jgi:hypothetical protein